MTTNKTERDAGHSAGRIYTFGTLPEKGIRYSSNHIRRLVAQGKFSQAFLYDRAQTCVDRSHARRVDRRARVRCRCLGPATAFARS